MIPVRNIYYKKSYAFQVLNENGYSNISTEEFENTADLFAAILSKGISLQLKRGLNKSYIDITEPLSAIKGKINVSDSIKTRSIMKSQLVCSYDEFSENCYFNKILKSTVFLLLKADISKARKKELKNLMLYFTNVDLIDVYSIDWHIKYNKNNGKICIEFNEIQKNYNTIIIRFKCEDTGIGMSESFQKTIYEPFAQEKAGARTVYGGTGLGMPITKSLVEKMGGTISFESEQGVGTTFYIELPFQIDHNIKHEELKTKEIKKASIKGVNVLLAEDNELNMEIAEFVLESAGANVIKAFNGKEALEIFKESKLGEIDIILMDVMMPVMDGLEAARYIRWSNKENARDIPIIAMTANAFTEDRRRVLEAGMNEHLAKPLESEVLIKTIANYCGKVDHFK